MDFSPLLLGLKTVLEPGNLFFCFLGVVLGQVVGILPGLGPPAAIAICLPVSFSLNPESAIIRHHYFDEAMRLPHRPPVPRFGIWRCRVRNHDLWAPVWREHGT